MRYLFLSIAVCFCLLAANPVIAQHSELKNGITLKRLYVNHVFPFDQEVEPFFDHESHTRAFELGYQRHLNSFLNLNIPLKFGVADYYEEEDINNRQREDFFLGLDALLQIKYFKPKKFFAPYLFVGIGGDVVEWDQYNAYIPAGVGLNIRLSDGFYLNVQSEYRYSLSDLRTNLTHGVGALILFGAGESEPTPPPAVVIPIDRDNDGIVDDNDDCPNEAGLAKFNGCPDTDGDNIADKNDDCPTVAGIAQFNGCPDTDGDGIADASDACPNEAGTMANNGCPDKDSDGDGIADSNDKCPNEAGIMRLNGCPDSDGDGIADGDDRCPNEAGLDKNKGCPDTDGDSIIDIDDKCPTKAGPITNKGCPEIKKEDREVLNFAMSAVEFETGRATIKESSYNVLDKIYDIMQKYAGYSLSIGGHTDSIGDSASNQLLSERRAKACHDYLIRKGVYPKRINYAGYGETQPIADNRYKDGRQKNRRVEFKLIVE